MPAARVRPCQAPSNQSHARVVRADRWQECDLLRPSLPGPDAANGPRWHSPRVHRSTAAAASLKVAGQAVSVVSEAGAFRASPFRSVLATGVCRQSLDVRARACRCGRRSATGRVEFAVRPDRAIVITNHPSGRHSGASAASCAHRNCRHAAHAGTSSAFSQSRQRADAVVVSSARRVS